MLQYQETICWLTLSQNIKDLFVATDKIGGRWLRSFGLSRSSLYFTELIYLCILFNYQMIKLALFLLESDLFSMLERLELVANISELSLCMFVFLCL